MWNRLKEPAPITDEFGDKRWYNKAGQLHRENDKPAIIWQNGYKEWWVNGKIHRDNDQPAYIGTDGHKQWWVNGKFIRGELPDE